MYVCRRGAGTEGEVSEWKDGGVWKGENTGGDEEGKRKRGGEEIRA